jgi:hypothetical protein
MRGLLLATGGLIGGALVFLGCLVLITGEAWVPKRGIYFHAYGVPAYMMGIGWVGLGIAIFCAGMLGAELGPVSYVRKCRDVGFVVFGIGLVGALLLAVANVYGNVAL